MTRAHEIARERAMVEEVVARLRADERRLLADASTLRGERAEIDGELTVARERVTRLEADFATEQLRSLVKERELMAARDELERHRELASDLQQEIEADRTQLATAQKRLSELAEDVVRIRQKVWRGTTRTPRGADRG